MLSLSFTRQAIKDMRSIPKADRDRLGERLRAYAAAPEALGHDVMPLVGQPGGFRLRTGEWRVLFIVTGGEMEIYRIRHRREAYR